MKEDFVRRAAGVPFIARDGAEIFELLRPETSDIKNMSIASGHLAPLQRALAHYHKISEEAYHVLRGEGRVRVGDSVMSIQEGDTVLVPIGQIHALENTSKTEKLDVLAISSPPYTDEDIFFVE